MQVKRSEKENKIANDIDIEDFAPAKNWSNGGLIPRKLKVGSGPATPSRWVALKVKRQTAKKK